MNTERDLLFLQPVFKHVVWGGEKLRTIFNYDEKGIDVGECWGISAHNAGDCRVGLSRGNITDVTLSQLVEARPDLFGLKQHEKYPLLVKIIDAKEDLSVQVHPDDCYAKKNENNSLGKTECWFVLDCEENSTLVVGHNATTKEQLSEMIDTGSWKSLLREIPINKGDFIQINPGTVHAIKGGCLILETQQSSDITYRLYDYDRLVEGKKRELHIEKSKDVIVVPANEVRKTIVSTGSMPINQINNLYSGDKYKISLCNVLGTMKAEKKDTCINISVVEGTGKLNGRRIQKGDHMIATSQCMGLEFKGQMQVVMSSVG